MSDCSKYANVSKGIFYNFLTVIMVASSYIVYTEWQPTWVSGFGDFKSISTALVDLTKTTQPIAEIMVEVIPAILVEMKNMNGTLFLMQQSVNHIDISVHGMNLSVWNMSHTVPRQMDKMQDRMSPMGFFK